MIGGILFLSCLFVCLFVCLSQARIQEFLSGGGVQHPKNFEKQKKKKQKKRTQRGWEGATLFILHWYGLKSNLAIETAFSDKIWPTWCLPNTETHLT